MPKLNGMKEICMFAGRTESTILALTRNEGFPARKVGKSWESETEKIEKWRAGRVKMTPLPKTKLKKKRRR